ncbi:hypothetical protein [Yoonia sp. I 8.24]|uniref:hypothetical protein n=1 Tax=Yoonia sp. I 8.24 TaxID=1537229 RepID=UPI001EDFF9B8|nr:hypothetical protein [Yoonia sp. I 8.24]MCG3267363.1 hypothetical protein [Yoonia sp. I 8.24]
MTSPPKNDSGGSVVSLSSTYEAYGMVMDFLAESDVFGNFELSSIAGVIRTQLRDGHNLAGLRDNTVVGYVGWLHTTVETGTEWMDGRAVLKPLYDENIDAAALTVFATSDTAMTPRLIRGARELNKGKRVFFKRGYDGVVRPGRKNTVLNIGSAN